MRSRLQLLLVGMTLSALALLEGCADPSFFQEPNWQHVYQQAALSPNLETKSDLWLRPDVPSSQPPATVLDPERAPRYLSLNEAIAQALENGTVGAQTLRVPGLAIEDLISFSGQGLTGSDSIRVLSYQPARIGTAIEAGLSRFDPFFSSGISWHTTDEPTQGLASLSNGNGASLTSSLIKPLATGGAVGVTFSTDYLQLANPPTGDFSVLNPSYLTRLQFGFDQPLLRDFGTEINQLRGSFPGSGLFSALNGRGTPFGSEGILITRVRHDQARAELERNVNFLLLNVQAAYWNLYGAYVNLYVNNQGLKQAHMSWSIGKELFTEGRIDKAQLSQIVAQYEQFRGDRMRALGAVLDAERNLRILCGLPVEDGQRLVPVDTPFVMSMKPDWHAAVHDALNLRPELVMARQDILAKQMNLTLQKNAMLPDLRLQATHTTVGLGSRLDGNGTFLDANGEAVTNNALRSLTSTHFNNWQVGLNLNVPLGYRYERAQIRDARLALTQSYLLLKSEETKAANFLAKQYARVIEAAETIEIRRRQRVAQAEQVETRFRRFIEWDIKDRYPHLEFLLDAQRNWASALNQEYQAILDYNVALATWEFAKGTIMQSCKVRISEGPLPDCVTRRAVDHERNATKMRVVAEQRRGGVQDDFGRLPLSNVAPEYRAPSVALLDVTMPRKSQLQDDGSSNLRKLWTWTSTADSLKTPTATEPPRTNATPPTLPPALGAPVDGIRFGLPTARD